MRARSGEPAIEPTTDELLALVRAVAEERDESAFEQLFRHYGPKIRGYMMFAVRDPVRAEEMTQETMVAIWAKADQFDPARGGLSAWIFAIARNRRIDAFRRERHPMFDPADPALVPDPDPAPHDVMVSRERAERLRTAMEGLRAEQLTLLHMAFFEDRSHSAIAERLGLPLGTVKSRLRLAFSLLRAALERTE